MRYFFNYYILHRQLIYFISNAAAIFLLVCLGCFMYVNLNTYHKLNNDLLTLNEKFKLLETQLVKRVKKQKEIDNLNSWFELQVNDFLPDFNKILKKIFNIIQGNHIQLASFNPENELIKNFYKEQFITLILNGSYHSIMSFITEIKKIKSLMIEDVCLESMHENLVKNDNLIFTVQFKLYQFT